MRGDFIGNWSFAFVNPQELNLTRGHCNAGSCHLLTGEGYLFLPRDGILGDRWSWEASVFLASRGLVRDNQQFPPWSAG